MEYNHNYKIRIMPRYQATNLMTFNYYNCVRMYACVDVFVCACAGKGARVYLTYAPVHQTNDDRKSQKVPTSVFPTEIHLNC